MINERDELAWIYMYTLNRGHGMITRPEQGNRAADMILAAGYRKPRTIRTAEERSKLRPGTICVDESGNAWKRGTGSWVSTGGDTGPLYDDMNLTLTILHEGESK